MSLPTTQNYEIHVTYLKYGLPGHPADWEGHGAIHLVVVGGVEFVVCSKVGYLYLVRLSHEAVPTDEHKCTPQPIARPCTSG
jgi:hypothetical protein